MRSYTLRNIPDDVYKSVQEAARSNGRSFNGEVLSILSGEAKLALRRIEMRRDLPKFRKFRDKLARKTPSRLDSIALIREDRDAR